MMRKIEIEMKFKDDMFFSLIILLINYEISETASLSKRKTMG